jgi:hypothetical protein
VLLLYPKILVIIEYPGSKLYTDAWGHFEDISHYYQNATFDVYGYYSVFPIVYSQILSMLNVTGIAVFYASTAYYLIINLLTALILYALCKELVIKRKTGGRNVMLPAIAVFVYSLVSYPNTSILRELPQSTGLMAFLFGAYVVLKAEDAKDRKYLVLSIFAFILALSHPFSAIFITCFFLLRQVLKYLSKAAATRILSFSFILLPLLFLLSYYLLFNFQQAQWLWSSLLTAIRALSFMISGGVAQPRLGEVSLDVKYPLDWERVLYGVNWAVPAAFGIAFLIVLFVRTIKQRNLGVLRTPSIALNAASMILALSSGLAFIFSFAEYAFSRYFGTYALIIGLPVIAYFVDRALRRSVIVRTMVIVLLLLMAFATLTDYDYLPTFQIGAYQRDREFASASTTIAEQLAAQFVAFKMSQNYSIVYADRNYAPTVHFFTESFSYSKPQSKTFSYPITAKDLELISQTEVTMYILIREAVIADQLQFQWNVLFYSNGDVYSLYANSSK